MTFILSRTGMIVLSFESDDKKSYDLSKITVIEKNVDFAQTFH